MRFRPSSAFCVDDFNSEEWQDCASPRAIDFFLRQIAHESNLDGRGGGGGGGGGDRPGGGEGVGTPIYKPFHFQLQYLAGSEIGYTF